VTRWSKEGKMQNRFFNKSLLFPALDKAEGEKEKVRTRFTKLPDQILLSSFG